MQGLRMGREYRESVKQIEAEIHAAADNQNSGKLLKIEKELKRLQKLIDGRAAQMTES
jgi:hypothetical protein